MSVVIIGGHERMETQYKEICKRYHCKVKVFTKMKTDLNHKIGNPDLMILFTATARRSSRPLCGSHGSRFREGPREIIPTATYFKDIIKTA